LSKRTTSSFLSPCRNSKFQSFSTMMLASSRKTDEQLVKAADTKSRK
jgi:hypothetical protein